MQGGSRICISVFGSNRRTAGDNLSGLIAGGGSAYRGLAWCSLHHGDTAAHGNYCPEEKMIGFHKLKVYRSIESCCICRAKSSTSRFTDSKHYEKDFQNCFGLDSLRRHLQCLCAVCEKMEEVAIRIKKQQKLEQCGRSKSRTSLKTTLKPKKVKTLETE